MQLEEDVEEPVADRSIHATRGEQTRRDECAIRDVCDLSDHATETEPDPEQIEQRFEEAGEDHHPAVLVDDEVALNHTDRPAQRRQAIAKLHCPPSSVSSPPDAGGGAKRSLLKTKDALSRDFKGGSLRSRSLVPPRSPRSSARCPYSRRGGSRDDIPAF